jgi:NAD(P)H-nitrite reductase large subunit
VRYRATNWFFSWCVQEGERADNPLDKVDPPHIPDGIQPFYRPEEVEAVLKSLSREGQAANETWQTSRPQVWAAGDVVSGAATVISAIGQAKKAASAIDTFL